MILVGLAALVLSAAGGGEGAWARAVALPPGPERAAAVVAALDAPGLEGDQARLVLAHQCGVRAAADLRLDQALAIQTRLHASQAAPWSLMNLSLTLHRSGRSDQADALLGGFPDGGDPVLATDLLSQRGIFALGRGDREAARSLLGRAVLQGSADASAVLALESLSRHDHGAAAAGFRGALVRSPDHPWALRGWGLTLTEADPPGHSGRTPSTSEPR